ncbi:hypothetical protein HHL11_25110 [Ramlibacter sp. G-1-2-2]|uniref:Uncharacterized protein n=1 Tax=Ramlibacter agri TaxID=2728837 RepID=A0A848HC32_9BURK|nr:hypothetical protein [Ramlibacter agri]NML47049.1 hypothetical protein [Ramlibacter agri]
MATDKKPEPPGDSTGSGWQESRLPGQRSGEGVKDIFKHVLRDIRRKAGLPPKDKSEKKKKP